MRSSQCARTLEQDLGRILLGAIRDAKDGTARFVVPVGSEEVHVRMSLKPLNSKYRARRSPRPESS